MRMNLFASCLVLATAQAIELVTNNGDAMSMTAEDNEFFLSQVDAEWASNGYRASNYKRPDDNCCILYLGKGWTEPDEEPVCWDKSPGAADKPASKMYGTKAKPTKWIRGVDCGKNTWAEIRAYTEGGSMNYRDSWAGRQTYELAFTVWNKQQQFSHIQVGRYDDTVMPALVLWYDKKQSCKFAPSFLLYNPEEPHPGQYDRVDYAPGGNNYRRSKMVDSMMLRPGYKAYLYEQHFWQGTFVEIEGAYEDLGEAEGRLKCQKITNDKIQNTMLGSLKIVKKSRGQATGYWKGITSSEAQEYIYTVGIKNDDSTKSVSESAAELNKSLETGYNASVTAEAKASYMGIGGSISGTAGMHGTSQSAEALKSSIKSEISNSASVGTTTTHRTTCTPKDGEDRTGLWQWVISSEDYAVAAYTSHTICRTGDKAFTEPECSFWDCDNEDCSVCKKTKAGESILRSSTIDQSKDESTEPASKDEGTSE